MTASRTALLSVSDKTGVVDFARALAARGFRLVSTGGTAKALAAAGLEVTEVADVTGHPEILDGRVKTLHPKIHGGLLARRDDASHVAALADHGIAPIDVLVVNLYPFAATTARADCTLADAIENIDIGGPAMLRAAAKNWPDVTVLVDPADYERVLAELDAGGPRRATKLALATKVYAHTAAYDAAVANYLGTLADGADEALDAVPARTAFAPRLTLQFTKLQDLRYGENPHQRAAFYRDATPPAGTLARARQLQGKELSYNNIADADAAWECVRSLRVAAAAQGAAGVAAGAGIAARAACVIVKHANPCGVGIGDDARQAYERAYATDPTSAFGGIVAFDVEVDGVTAAAVAKPFVEVVVAPGFDADARRVFAAKANVRLLEVPGAGPAVGATADDDVDFQRVGGGLLVQSRDARNVTLAELRVVTRRAPTPAQIADLLFAWRVAKFVKSNAIVFCRDGATLGVGAGQMSRIDSARIASIKAAAAGLSLAGSAVASDAFFPFRDGLDVVADAGADCVVQPGGSVRDAEVIAAADERGLAMVFTATRHFRH